MIQQHMQFFLCRSNPPPPLLNDETIHRVSDFASNYPLRLGDEERGLVPGNFLRFQKILNILFGERRGGRLFV